MKDYYNTHKYTIFDIFPRSNKFYLKSNNICKELVLYGTNIESNAPKFTSIVNYMINLPDDIYYILSGIILSDGYIKTTFNNKTRRFIKTSLKTTYNSRFSFKQSIQHIEYILYTYNKLAHYCISAPKIKVESLKGKLFTAVTFDTRALPCFSVLRDTFYQDLDCTLHKSRNKYVIYIRSRSMPILYKGISPYLIPSMHYKFHKKILEIGCPAEGG
ncbi:hypothetical protein METBIDRAFT_86634 [Metschnikowia bicuspidata var. bicuspidata NRRL YB-4993]|uniref:Homing endonuclease LAGLIDADG domain-containing protein n=1 Tax=Metschnikowia bicuspidata var. bicuspidata NRRL YB-4993 TaxID=869754 RepID=A0A1A0HDA6_9ASCO|nr:hypothetical protein METBIDRAFT_86634 [Metschnikowia bicuspidata var. bicuspidata NRRL YB-4993]OBA21913.1 hypothetical protein METBIDRAFT_86634 [Metschnikowia bicuspidata var. bicuspidata NRRL YB-4993]